MAQRSERIAAFLHATTGAAAAISRPDPVAARRERIDASTKTLWGAPPDAPLAIREGTRHYAVDVRAGQKTGFYLDARDARALLETRAAGARVLDLFGYTGGFSVAAAAGGARSVTIVDSSAPALALAERNFDPYRAGTSLRVERSDAFRWVRADRAEYDLLVVDPPPLARRKADAPRASRAYKDVLLHSFRRAAPGAQLLVFSCSHYIGPDLFRKITFGASLDAGRSLQVLAELGAPSDHPVALDHPEGRYFTGLWLRT
jgi:23S rRNA (cytosine1962-C5)-methyltransferase